MEKQQSERHVGHCYIILRILNWSSWRTAPGMYVCDIHWMYVCECRMNMWQNEKILLKTNWISIHYGVYNTWRNKIYENNRIKMSMIDQIELFQGTSPNVQHLNQIDYILWSQRWRSSIQSAKQDQELTVAQIMNSLLPNSDWNWRK